MFWKSLGWLSCLDEGTCWSVVSLQPWWSWLLASVDGDVCCLLMAVTRCNCSKHLLANASGHLPEPLGRSLGDVSMRLIQREADRRVFHSFLRCEGLLGLERCCRPPSPGKRCNRILPVTCYNWWSCAAMCTPTWSMHPAHRALLPCSLTLPPPCSDLFLEKLLSLLRHVFYPSNEMLETFETDPWRCLKLTMKNVSEPWHIHTRQTHTHCIFPSVTPVTHWCYI